MTDYVVKEADGTSRFQLEDSSGFLLLEQASGAPAASLVSKPQRPVHILTR
jgi:hypothetical protein